MAESGRPTKFREEYCYDLVEHMALGMSYESFAGKIRVNRDTLYHWEKLFPQFSDAKKMGRDACLFAWEKVGMNQAVKGKGNAATWIFNMKNRFNWTDKNEIKNSYDQDSKQTLVIEYKKQDSA